MKFYLVVAAIFLLSVPEVFAQKLIINEFGFKLSEQDREKITKLAEYEARLYDELFETDKNSNLEIVVNIYKKKSDYKKACLEAGIRTLPSNGVFSPWHRQCFVFKGADYLKTVVHEMGHAFMHNNLSNPPRWLNEGISEFFESLSVSEGRVTVSEQPGRLMQVSKQLRLNFFSLKEFLQQNTTGWGDEEKRSDMYSISYSIVHYMMKTKPDNLRKLTLALKTQGVLPAIQSVYGSLSRFEEGYTLFYRGVR